MSSRVSRLGSCRDIAGDRPLSYSLWSRRACRRSVTYSSAGILVPDLIGQFPSYCAIPHIARRDIFEYK